MRRRAVYNYVVIAHECNDDTKENTMTTNLTPEARTASRPDRELGRVTLMNSFQVAPGRDEAFQALWTTTSQYFISRPGFVSLRLHRAVSPDVPYRWVNVANWESEADYRSAHSTEEFRRVVTAEGWSEFPSVPLLYEVVTAVE
jgi:heme-degrading monooxygenase HmoA